MIAEHLIWYPHYCRVSGFKRVHFRGEIQQAKCLRQTDTDRVSQLHFTLGFRQAGLALVAYRSRWKSGEQVTVYIFHYMIKTNLWLALWFIASELEPRRKFLGKCEIISQMAEAMEFCLVKVWEPCSLVKKCAYFEHISIISLNISKECDKSLFPGFIFPFCSYRSTNGCTADADS